MSPLQDGWSRQHVEHILAEGDPAELLHLPVAVSMDPPDAEWAQGICIELAGHSDAIVRGNALLGFGHLARTTGALDAAFVRPLIEDGRKDSDPYIRSQAEVAVEDTESFLGWRW